MAALATIRSHRDLLTNLTLRELRGKYKRSVLGWAWSMLNPLANMAIFTVVFLYFLKVPVPVGHPSGLKVFAFYLLCALLPWNFLAAALTGGMGALIGNANLIKKVYFPRVLLVGASVSALAITLLIELGVFGGALLIGGNNIIPWIPAVLLVVALQALFVLGMSMLLSVIAVYFRDMEHLIGILLQLWFYATPVIYPKKLAIDFLRDKPTLRWFYEANPMGRFASIYRDLLYNLRGPKLTDIAAVGIWTVVALAIGALVFRKLEPRLAEEL
jgi:ABC-2 type transport system permease protein